MERYPDRHHILYNRTAWESNSSTKWLREESGLIVRMGREAHLALHDEVSVVPLLSPDTARSVRSILSDSDAMDPLDIADDFMSAVQEVGRRAKTKQLDRALGELVIMAVEAQREYIEDGVMAARVFDLGTQSRLSIASRAYESLQQSA